MFLEQPYDSKTLNKINKSDQTFLVNRYIIGDYGYLLSNENLVKKDYSHDGRTLKQVVLYGLTDSEKEIADMEFPLIDFKKGWICFDMRRYVTADKGTGNVTLKSVYDLDLQLLKNQFTGLWAIGLEKDLYNFKLPHVAFAKWISQTISSRFGLGAVEEGDIEILSLIYYSRLFNRDGLKPADELELLSVRFKESFFTRGSLESVYNLSQDMSTLEDFCEMIVQIVGSARLTGFTSGVLLQLVQNSWMGPSYKDQVALCLEFPPMWISMFYLAAKSSQYKRTKIGDVAQSLGRRGESISFVKSVDGFMTIQAEGL